MLSINEDDEKRIQLAEDGKDIHKYNDGYILAGDGIYEKSSSKWLSYMTKAKNIPGIPKLDKDSFLVLKLPKIPFNIFLDSWKFFQKVYEKHKSEAIGLITYDGKEYDFVIPKQKVSGASLDYDTDGIINVIGTIHSHANMGAFHSGTDDSDEEKFDGIHLTLGKMENKSFPDISCSVTKNGERFIFELWELFEFGTGKPTMDLDKELEKVSKKGCIISDSRNEEDKYGLNWGYGAYNYSKYNNDKTSYQSSFDTNYTVDMDAPGNDFDEFVEKMKEMKEKDNDDNIRRKGNSDKIKKIGGGKYKK